jgi:hypothetical protein
MSTDAGTSADSALSAELEKAAELLKSKGLNHAAAHLLEPENGVTPSEPKAVKAVKNQRKPGKVTTFHDIPAAVNAVNALMRDAGEAKAQKAKAKAKATVKIKAIKVKAIKAKAIKAKAKTAKAKTKTTKRKPVSGQSGPRIAELGWDDLNKREKLVLGVFDLEGEREVRTIEDIGANAFPNQPLKKQNSWTRNSLRRPMRSGVWLEKTEPGKYRLTQAARTKLRA